MKILGKNILVKQTEMSSAVVSKFFGYALLSLLEIIKQSKNFKKIFPLCLSLFAILET